MVVWFPSWGVCKNILHLLGNIPTCCHIVGYVLKYSTICNVCILSGLSCILKDVFINSMCRGSLREGRHSLYNASVPPFCPTAVNVWWIRGEGWNMASFTVSDWWWECLKDANVEPDRLPVWRGGRLRAAWGWGFTRQWSFVTVPPLFAFGRKITFSWKA